jgi:hypothetical protein
MLHTLDSPFSLFEDAIKMIESRFPAQTTFSISNNPLVCTTPLMQSQRGILEPRIEGQYRYS